MLNPTLHHVPPARAGLSAVLLRSEHEAADRHFIGLVQAYRARGGLLSLKEVLQAHVEDWPADALQSLADRVLRREVLGLPWDQRLWVPAFQFGEAGQVSGNAAAVFTELTPVFDAWGLASWFVSPSCWLQDRRPVELLASAGARVLGAARVDRYVATGG
jgi:hypothetical protein